MILELKEFESLTRIDRIRLRRAGENLLEPRQFQVINIVESIVTGTDQLV
jgi:hypothetical protein